MTKNNRHSNAVDMVREILGDEDPQFADDLQRQIQSRQLVRLLATLRNKSGVKQEDVANELGCRQAKISKIENGVDSSVCLGEIEAYAKATNCDVELVFRSRNITLVDEIKYHAFCIRKCFDKLTGLAKNDETVSRGVAKFHLESLYNLANIIKTSVEKLRWDHSKGHVHVRTMEDEDCLIGDRHNAALEANHEAVLS